MKLLPESSPLVEIARQGKRLPHIIVTMLMGLIGIQIAPGLVLLASQPLGKWLTQLGNTPILTGLHQTFYFWFSFIPMALTIFAWVKWFEKRPLASLGFPRQNACRDFCRGALLGFAMLSVTVGGMVLSGYSQFVAGDPAQTGMAAVGGVFIVLLGFMVQASTEEIVFRGWMLPVLSARYRVWVGVLVSSVIFMILHLGNPGVSPLAVVNLLLFGIFTSLWALWEGGIWGVSAWHMFWNWAQGNIYGLKVSGTVLDGGSLLSIASSGPTWLAGADFGPEVTIFTTVVLLVGIGVLVYLQDHRSAHSVAAVVQTEA